MAPTPRKKASTRALALSAGGAWRAAMLEDLARSGLDARDAELMRLEPRDAAAAPVVPQHAGYVIPYFALDGRIDAATLRFRYLEDTRSGFAKLAGHKPLRYMQPAGTPPGVYLPPYIDWSAYAQSTDPLLITEGEKKAAVATKHGVPTLGLGGVWSFRSKRQGETLLAVLQRFVWAERAVYIVYDSDAVLNPDVCRAEQALAAELTRAGAKVFVVRLTAASDGAKRGLDDYLLEHTAEELTELCQRTEPYAASRALYEMNAEVLYVKDPGVVYVTSSGQLVKPGDFVSHRYADRQYTRAVVLANGGTKLEVRSTAADWLRWSHRAAVERFVFAPGQPTVTEHGELNLWRGWPVEPRKGDVRPWHDLLDHIFSGDKASRAWFEQWAALPLQVPGTKHLTAVVVWGRRTGTGKSLVAYTLGDLYGDGFAEIDDDKLRGTNGFNSWARHRQFVLGDDITGNDSRLVTNRIKVMITRERLEINLKNVPQYTIADCINYFFTSNSPDAFYMGEEDDRRLFIHEVRGAPLTDAFYTHYDVWRRSEGGRAALMYYLLNEVDCSGFNSKARAPETRSKAEMFALTRTDLESWLIHAREHPDTVCSKLGNSDLVTAQELLTLYDPLSMHRVTAVGMARKLKELGIEPAVPYERAGVANSQLRVGPESILTRLYPLRNHGRWAKASANELRKHFEECRGLDTKRKKF